MLNLNMTKIESEGQFVVKGISFKLTDGDASKGSGQIKVDGSDVGTFLVSASPTSPNLVTVDAKFETNETSWPTLHVVQECSNAQFSKPWDLVIKQQGNLLKGDLILPGDKSTSTWTGSMFGAKDSDKSSRVNGAIKNIRNNRATPNTVTEVL